MSDSTNIIQFRGELAEFAKKVRIDASAAMKAVSREVMERVRELTPVSSGRARDNWNMTVGAPSGDYDEHKDWKRGEAHEPKPIPDLQIDGTQPVFIANNAPYILLLENGSSEQAPSGMAGLAVAVAEERMEQVVREFS
jgi:hypothetical protein